MDSSSQGQSRKYLTFRLAEEEYGVDILKVREIIGLMPITPVPRTDQYLRGVINLRGKIIPVFDLRSKIGAERLADTRETCIITVTMKATQGQLVVGLLVDAVNEVIEVDSSQIEDLPEVGKQVRLDFVLGLAKVHEKVCILLDAEGVIESADLADLAELQKEMQSAAETVAK